MQAGKLRHRLTIQQLVDGSPPRLPSGAPNQAWADVATVYASIRNLRGQALFAAQQAESKVTAEIEIRWRAGVTAAMRALFQGTVYDIVAVMDPDGTREKLVLQCATGANNG